MTAPLPEDDLSVIPTILSVDDTDPVLLEEDAAAESEPGLAQAAQEHFGDEDPHDEQDALEGVEVDTEVVE